VVINPIFWLVLSFLLVSVSLTAVLVVLVPAVVELSRAARSFEKLCDTIDRDLPPTLASIRQPTAEIARLTDEVNAGVHHAGRVAQQVDQGMSSAHSQAKRAQVNTRSLMAGMGAAWATLTKPEPPRDRPRRSPSSPQHSGAARSADPARSPAKSPQPSAANTPPPEVDQTGAIADAAIGQASATADAANAEVAAAADPQASPETP